MGRREDFKRILNHQQPEHAILDLGGCPLSTMHGRSYENLMKYLGFDMPEDYKEEVLIWGQVHRLDDRLPEALDVDTRGVGAVMIPGKSLFRWISPAEYMDEWGIRRKFTGLYWDIIESPLRGKSAEDLKEFPWPDPDSIDMEFVRKEAKRAKHLYENTDYIVVADLPTYGVFELADWMCGFDDYLMKMALDEDFVHEFSGRVLTYQKRILQLYLEELGTYIHVLVSGDDFATQKSQFVSQKMFRELIAPYFKARIDCSKEYTDAAILHHSCGSVAKLIPELKACGVDILNPIQPGAADMEPEKIKPAYGDEMIFHGGLDIQEVLPFGTEEDVEQAVKEIMRVMNKDGGYIFAAAHNIQEDAPPQNIVAMFRAARKWGEKGAFTAHG